jgi:hypothetical protein
MKMELKNARVVLQLQALPNLRRGRFGFAFGAPFFSVEAPLADDGVDRCGRAIAARWRSAAAETSLMRTEPGSRCG